jgi:hypothetical protein
VRRAIMIVMLAIAVPVLAVAGCAIAVWQAVASLHPRHRL